MSEMAGAAKIPNPTQRFSNRVENYVCYRPGYPNGMLELLSARCGLTRESTIADIGSGTGKLAELFLAIGQQVIGVEPNREMREAGERLLGYHSAFRSVAGSAEDTTMAAACVDLLVAGQAFHWFDRERCRAEFIRILKPGGWVALIWNDRRTDATPFLLAYEQLLREFATDYEQVNHRNIDQRVLTEFFGAEPELQSFPYAQSLDFDGLKGRLLSSSYAPEAGQPRHDEMMAALRRIFEGHQRAGYVRFEYDTRVYLGRLN
jgi:SAM-dependent methyltransferase